MTHNQIRHLMRGLAMRVGTLEKAVLEHDDDFIMWLMKETPEGGTVAETLLAIATDAYHEEKMNDTTKQNR